MDGPAVIPLGTAAGQPAAGRPAAGLSVADLPGPGASFSFVVISDRTGGARPGVFERGLAVTDLLAPSFAVQLGDLIQGYTDDLSQVEDQWRQVDAMFATMRTRVFPVPGNHDAYSAGAAGIWRRRYGPNYYHFCFADCLFLCLDTQDPPEDPAGEDQVPPWTGDAHAHPADYRRYLLATHDWEGRQPARMSEEQLAYVEEALRAHRDARWTFLMMHMPLWQGESPTWQRLRRALGTRPYHAFAGHVHNYRHQIIDGRSHVRMGPTGGMWVLDGPDGNFDHVALVTVTATEPVIANIILDGVRDIGGCPIRPVATGTVPLN